MMAVCRHAGGCVGRNTLTGDDLADLMELADSMTQRGRGFTLGQVLAAIEHSAAKRSRTAASAHAHHLRVRVVITAKRSRTAASAHGKAVSDGVW